MSSAAQSASRFPSAGEGSGAPRESGETGDADKQVEHRAGSQVYNL
jgi:hypothetical protein